MMLTLAQSRPSDFEFGLPHELVATPPPLRTSPEGHFGHILGPGPPNPITMSTTHRGLPPPSAITQPPPPPPPTQVPVMPPQPPLGQLPPPPLTPWQGGEDSMRHWLSAKAEEERTKQEEEKRRQEEERSRQESLRLEQRLIEQSMLRDSMQGGIPAHMIPIIFAGMGGPSIVSASVELLQQYAAQLQAGQQHARVAIEPSQEPSMEARAVQQQQYAHLVHSQQMHPTPPPQHQHPPQQQQQIQHHPQQHATFPSAFAPSARPAMPTSAPHPPPGLTRIDTIDSQQPAGPAVPYGALSGHPEQDAASPPIYFHHWIPPATGDGKAQRVPSPPQPFRGQSAAPSSYAGDVEMRDSPRKRKAVGGHGPIPPPQQPQQTSPTYSSHSSTRSRGDSISGGQINHVRSRSNKSSEEMMDPSRRPPSRRDSAATHARLHEHGFSQELREHPLARPGNRGSQYIR